MITIFTSTEEATRTIGTALGQAVEPGDILLLSGGLGAGKTVLAQGIAQGIQVTEAVTSPTFGLMHVYDGRIPVYHFDLYRLRCPEELYDLDYEEYFYGEGAALVEWPERLKALMPHDYLLLSIIQGTDGLGRHIQGIAMGMGHHRLLEVLKSYENPRH